MIDGRCISRIISDRFVLIGRISDNKVKFHFPAFFRIVEFYFFFHSPVINITGDFFFLRFFLRKRKYCHLFIIIKSIYGQIAVYAVHLENVPRNYINNLVQFADFRLSVPLVLHIVAKRHQQIYSGYQKAVTLIFIAVGALIGSCHPFQPFFFIVRIFAHHSQFAVKNAYSLTYRDFIAC